MTENDFPTIIGADAKFKGDLSFDKSVKVLGSFEGRIDTKGDLVVASGGMLQADVEAIKAERQRLSAREKTLARKADWLKAYLLHALRAAGKCKVKGHVLTVSLRKAPISCEVLDADEVPDDFKREVTEVKVDRNAIIAHFRSTGEILPGVRMVTDKRTVSIR